jgi:hypothetical protein
MRETLNKSRVVAWAGLTLTTVMIATSGTLAAPQPLIVSARTTTAPANCWIDGPGRVEDSPIRVCHGKATLVVLVNKGDLRETVSVGRNRNEAAQEPAAQAAFGPFKQALPAIEWRIAGNNPFAIIQRWRAADDRTDPKNGPAAKPLLVVSRLPPGAVCPVAYVDSAANPNADELAHKAADEVARDFKCGRDQAKILGSPGRAAALASHR